jgi:hypothetical protein
MSNFLQRVAATIIQPQAKLQPMLGSIFAPATPYSTAEPFRPEVSSQTVAPRSHGQLTAPPSYTSSLPFADHPESKDLLFPSMVHEDSSLARFNKSPATNQPLLPAFDSLNDSRGQAQPHPFAEDSAFEFTKPAANQSPGPSPYQPLIAASQPPPLRLQPLDSLPNPASARTVPSEAARRFQPSQRETDEIHIHIGRIEVAAIAQAAPRPAAAAARRSLNLDEYLRRHNGRPG